MLVVVRGSWISPSLTLLFEAADFFTLSSKSTLGSQCNGAPFFVVCLGTEQYSGSGSG